VGVQVRLSGLTAPVILVWIALVWIALVPTEGSAASLGAGDACPKPDVLAKLEKDLAVALGNRFEFVDGVLAEMSTDGRCFWLARIRAREPGEFVIRYTDGMTVTFRLVIGKAETSRVYQLAQSGYSSVYPHACVGDTLVLPVRVDPMHSSPSFSMPAERSALDRATFQTMREFGGDQPFKRYQGDVEIHNGADDVLKLRKSAAGFSPNRSFTELHHHLVGWFDVRARGKFNLVVALNPDPRPDPQPNPELAVQVAPRGKPVETFIWKWDSGEELPIGEHRLRVGDRLILGTGYRTVGTEVPAKHPSVEVKKRPFAAAPSPFVHVRSE